MIAKARTIRTFIIVALSCAAASSISLIGGVGLEAVSEKILPLVPMLIAIPALNDLVGSYAAVIAAHTGDPTERQRSHKELARVIYRVALYNIVAIALLSLLVASFRGYYADFDFLLRFGGFVLVSVLIVVSFMFALAGGLDRLLRNHRYNPDELLIPVVTSLADILMLGLVALAVLTIF